MPNILAFAELRDGELKKVAREVVSAARVLADQLGGEVDAVALGPSGTGNAISDLGGFGADRIHVGESDALRHYSPEAFTTVLVDLLRSGSFATAVFPASTLGKDLAPRVAARLGVPYAGECTALEIEGGTLIATRPEYAGKVFARVRFTDSPAVISIRPNTFPATESPRAGAVQALDLSLNQADFGSIVREIRAAAGEKLDVAEAPIVVSGGRGLKDPANFKLIEELADAFGSRAAVGASRAVVDAGWRPHAEQVGQTGKTVSPTLYFAIGISGAMQHLAGMRTSKYIVAINKDPEAPIFKVADYGIVGDLMEIVPRLTEEVRKLR